MREERLRATAGLRHSSLTLSSWRGRSGRRYIVGVHPLVEAEILEVTDAVILAVRRDEDGTAHVIDVATAGSRPSGTSSRRRSAPPPRCWGSASAPRSWRGCWVARSDGGRGPSAAS